MITHENDIVVKILKVDEDTVCVEFTNLNGPNLQFYECYNEIKDKVLNMTNDVSSRPAAD